MCDIGDLCNFPCSPNPWSKPVLSHCKRRRILFNVCNLCPFNFSLCPQWWKVKTVQCFVFFFVLPVGRLHTTCCYSLITESMCCWPDQLQFEEEKKATKCCGSYSFIAVCREFPSCSVWNCLQGVPKFTVLLVSPLTIQRATTTTRHGAACCKQTALLCPRNEVWILVHHLPLLVRVLWCYCTS